jgi:hypothetical protein
MVAGRCGGNAHSQQTVGPWARQNNVGCGVVPSGDKFLVLLPDAHTYCADNGRGGGGQEGPEFLKKTVALDSLILCDYPWFVGQRHTGFPGYAGTALRG